jgi:hypothetical protein
MIPTNPNTDEAQLEDAIEQLEEEAGDGDGLGDSDSDGIDGTDDSNDDDGGPFGDDGAGDL